MDTFPVVIGSSGKLIAGHDTRNPMTDDQAQARCNKANADAEQYGLECRYKVDHFDANQIRTN